jgi:hypothetical protein
MQKRLEVYALLLMMAAGLGLAGCGTQRPGKIGGAVSDAQSGKAAAQAHVVVYGLSNPEGTVQIEVYQKGGVLQEALVDEKGEYSLSLNPGAYIVEVWVNGQKVGNRMVKVRSGRAAVVDFKVELPSP